LVDGRAVVHAEVDLVANVLLVGGGD
jgi:hypothetical protein